MGRKACPPDEDFVAVVRDLRRIDLPWQYVAVALNERKMLNCLHKPWTAAALQAYCRKYREYIDR